MGHLGPEFGAEDLGECLDRQIEIVGGRQPTVAVRGQAAGRDDDMEMGVILHLSAPGMEHGGKPRQLSANEARIFDQFFNRPACRLEHGAVGSLLMAAAEGPELFGYGEGEHEVVAGQSPLKLGIEPLAALEVLALGTVAIAAGAVDPVLLPAAVALIDNHAEFP